MDWGKIVGPLLQQTAPAIAGILVGEIPIVGPLLQGVTQDAVGALIAKQFGVEPTPEAVGKAIQDTPSDVAVAKVQAAQAEAVEKWPALADIIKAQEEGRTERFRIGTADNADARGTMTKLVDARSPMAWAPVVVSVVIVIGYFIVLDILLFRPFKLDDNFKDILLFMLGGLQAAFIQVVQYWLGSSAGSAGKDVALRDIAATSVVAAANAPPSTKGPVKR